MGKEGAPERKERGRKEKKILRGKVSKGLHGKEIGHIFEMEWRGIQERI